MRSRLVGFCLLAAAHVGCAHTKPSETAPPPAPPAPVAEADAAAPPPAPEPAPAPASNFACRAKPQVCAEYQGVPADEATRLRDQCTREGGELLDACPTAKWAGRCEASRPTFKLKQVLYRAKKPHETRKMVVQARQACETNGGTFTVP